jgi:hypothetical protein
VIVIAILFLIVVFFPNSNTGIPAENIVTGGSSPQATDTAQADDTPGISLVSASASSSQSGGNGTILSLQPDDSASPAQVDNPAAATETGIPDANTGPDNRRAGYDTIVCATGANADIRKRSVGTNADDFGYLAGANTDTRSLGAAFRFPNAVIRSFITAFRFAGAIARTGGNGRRAAPVAAGDHFAFLFQLQDADFKRNAFHIRYEQRGAGYREYGGGAGDGAG